MKENCCWICDRTVKRRHINCHATCPDYAKQVERQSKRYEEMAKKSLTFMPYETKPKCFIIRKKDKK